MFGSIITFLIVLSILVLVHELGHFLVAKKSGVWVEEFGFGIPPRLFGKKVGETIYSLNLFPFGGFVRLHGELTEENVTKPKRSFMGKSKKAKIAIISAGVVMNFILAIFCFAIVYSFSGIPRVTEDVRIVEVFENSPADSAGLVAEDIVYEIAGANVATIDEFINVVGENKEKEINFQVIRGEEQLSVSLTPRETPPEGEGPVGVAITTMETYFPPFWQRPFIGAYHGFQEALFWGGAVVGGFGKMIVDLFAGQAPKDIAGPVGIFAITTEAASHGILTLINFVGVFSVNLAVLNFIPFPGLDGGRLLFIGIESVFGKKVLPKIEPTIHAVGLLVLIGLLLLITVHDIRGLIAAGSLSGFLENVLR